MSVPRQPDHDGPLDPGFVDIKRLIIERTGHAYYADKDDILFERVRRRIQAAGARGFSDYLDRLAGGSDEAEWSALVSEVTIGETFFFRFREQFAALKNTILPDLIARRGGDRRLRIWSAGCSNGSEAYSLAITLSELIGPEILDWRISVIGTDIDEAALQRARSGVFGAWSLRAVDAAGRDAWFDAGPRSGTYSVKRRFRPIVRFERHNLLSMLDGTSPLQFTDFDLILCRNVLIYFKTETVIQLVAALGEALRPEGWLLLGHAETNPAFTASLVPVEIAGATVYRRPGPHLPTTPALRASEPSAAVPLPAIAEPTRKSAPRAVARATRTLSPTPPTGAAETKPISLVEQLRSLADAGDFAGALAVCREGEADRPTDPLLRFYEGLIHRALGDQAAAASALRRAIYLDRAFALAHYHLGLVLLAQGDRTAGRRAVANAGRLAAAMPGTADLAEGDGLTAADLVAVARLVLSDGGPR
ncbi:CheR family methyltransferase [Chthonobacter albigriseus]|uniref:CheR family methyltransferase n=1 Tax=Chthonobacter albigriseus TaxID=1683161 RepID=UPI0015EF626D|nr:protein-glutamate O-methyltransferase CheR [Chthonobacter albigriseus]